MGVAVPSRASRAAGTGPPVAPVLAAAHRDRRRAVEQLRTFVGLPSVSGDPRHANDLIACAQWLAAELRGIGLDGVRIDGDVVWGAWRHAQGRPTVLVYGHYDVVPTGALSAWRSPPFAPAVRSGRVHGRGSSDDKGQLFAHVKAIEAWLRATSRLPVNLVCLFEGGEEIGSPALPDFIARHRQALRCDAAVISDTRMLAPGRPALTYGLRGSLTVELCVRTGAAPLHSGHFGGAVAGAAQTLAALVAGLHRADGGAAVAGFYRDVREQPAGARDRTTVRPALIVTGLRSGGSHGAIPAVATALLNMRLVPDQDPDTVERLLREHVTRSAPAAARVTLRRLSAARPVLIDPRRPALAAAARAYERGIGRAPALVRSGGTIPVVDLLGRELGVPVVLMGFALPDDNAHAPNESFALSSFFGGTKTAIHFLHEMSAVRPPRASERQRRPPR